MHDVHTIKKDRATCNYKCLYAQKLIILGSYE